MSVKWAGLAMISIVGWVVALPFVPVQVAYRLFSKEYDLDYYFKQIAVGNDVMAGSMIYGSKHTISAITGAKASKGGRWHRIQEMVIDLFFGDGHCRREAIKEKLITGENVDDKRGIM